MKLKGRDAGAVIRTLAKALRKAERRAEYWHERYEQENDARTAEAKAREEKATVVAGTASPVPSLSWGDLGVTAEEHSPVNARIAIGWGGPRESRPIHSVRTSICKGDSAKVIGTNVLTAMRAKLG